MRNERESLRAWLALLSSANAIKKSVDWRMRQKFGHSISRFDVLAALDRAGTNGCTAGTLSGHLMVTDGNTTQITAPLIEEGLITRNASVRDGRVAIFRLTRKGRRLFADMAEANRRWTADFFSPLTAAQIANLREVLSVLRHQAFQSRGEAA